MARGEEMSPSVPSTIALAPSATWGGQKRKSQIRWRTGTVEVVEVSYILIIIGILKSLSSFVRSHMVSWEAGLGLVLRTVTKACVCFHGDAQRYRTDSGCWPLTLSRHNQLLQNPRLSRTMSSRGQMLDRIKLMPLKLPRFYNPL